MLYVYNMKTTKTPQGYKLTVNDNHYEISKTDYGYWQISTNGRVYDSGNTKRECLEMIQEWEKV